MSVSTRTNIEAAIARLAKLAVPQLQQHHVDLFGEKSRTPHRQYLFRKIAWELQARQERGLSEEIRQYALGIARDSALRVRIAQSASRDRSGGGVERTVTAPVTQTHDSRVPFPGSSIFREYKGRSIVVTVLDEGFGFEWEGRRFNSLSAIAKEITGTKWNGLLFFGLTKEDHGHRR
jgi:hypothetical protein